jgi:hypothetical protein
MLARGRRASLVVFKEALRRPCASEAKGRGFVGRAFFTAPLTSIGALGPASGAGKQWPGEAGLRYRVSARNSDRSEAAPEDLFLPATAQLIVNCVQPVLPVPDVLTHICVESPFCLV